MVKKKEENARLSERKSRVAILATSGDISVSWAIKCVNKNALQKMFRAILELQPICYLAICHFFRTWQPCQPCSLWRQLRCLLHSTLCRRRKQSRTTKPAFLILCLVLLEASPKCPTPEKMSSSSSGFSPREEPEEIYCICKSSDVSRFMM